MNAVDWMQFRELLALRLKVTWRTYTATASARLEGLLFLPAILLSAWGIQRIIFELLQFVLDPQTLFRILSVNLVMLMHVTLVFLAVGWSIVPALGFRVNEALDYQRLRAYPTRFPTVFFASLVGYVLDISTLLPLAMCVGVLRFVALITAATNQITLNIVDYAALLGIGLVFLALLLQLSWLAVQVFMHLLPKLDFTQLILGFFVGCLILVIGVNLRLMEYPDGTTLFDELFIDRYNALPTGPIALALHEFHERNGLLMWRFIAQGWGWVLGLLTINGLLLSIIVQGRCFGLERWINFERIGIAGKSARVQQGAGWPRWVRHPALVVAWKDSRDLLRNRHFFFFKAMPGVLAPAIILLAGKQNVTLLRGQSDLLEWFLPLYLGLTLLIFIAQANLFIANYFGFERDHIAALLTTPARRLDILRGKNLFLALICLPDVLVISSLSLWLLVHPQVGHWLVAVAALLSILTHLLGLGNLASVLVPYYAPLDRPVISLQGAVVVGLVNSAMMLALALLLIPTTLFLVGPWYWARPLAYTLTLPLWLAYQAGIYNGLTIWAARLMPDYEEWIQLRVRGVL